MSEIKFQIVEHGSPAYRECLMLREEILRKPLGLTLSAEELAQDSNCIHIAGFHEGRIQATTILVPYGKKELQMRQVAVSQDAQGLGFGTKMMVFCEDWAAGNGFAKIFCHARNTALPFYERMGFQTRGESFLEQGIPHTYMFKDL